MRYAAATEVGLVRSNNEDSLFASTEKTGFFENLFIIADGMGGHRGGEYASQFVVSRIPELLRADARDVSPRMRMETAVRRANRELFDISEENGGLQGMGTTLVLATILGGKAYVLNIGDSRLYYSNGGLRQVTRDHSLVEEMVEAGRLTRDDPLYRANKNVITRAVGTEPYVDADYFELDIGGQGRLLLCTDGLSGQVTDADIEAVLRDEDDLNRAVRRLTNMALAAGGPDNISMILIELGGGIPERESIDA